MLWRAPELLRDPCALPRGSQKGDIYSFGLILYEIFSRNCPYWTNTGLSPKGKVALILYQLRQSPLLTGLIICLKTFYTNGKWNALLVGEHTAQGLIEDDQYNRPTVHTHWNYITPLCSMFTPEQTGDMSSSYTLR